MSAPQQQTGGGGIGLSGVLLVVFVVLKLTGHIAWSWWWVLSPLWIGAVLVALFLGAAWLAVLVLGRRGGRS